MVEVALRLPFAAVIAGLLASSTRALRVVRAQGVSDHWKEKALTAYARTTFLSSIRLAGLLFVIIAMAGILIFVFELMHEDFPDFIFDWRGIGFSIIFASVYFKARKSLFHGQL